MNTSPENAQGDARPKAAITPDVTLRAFLESPEARATLGAKSTPELPTDDLIRCALIAATREPLLYKCTKPSIVAALVDAATLKIRPGGLVGRGYLVPRAPKNGGPLECRFDPGYRGLIDIATRGRSIQRIEAHAVFRMDRFSYVNDPLTRVSHHPYLEGDAGDVVAAFAAAVWRDGGGIQTEVVLRRDIEKIRSFADPNGPWADWYDEMSRKTAVRRLGKYLPYDPSLEKALLLAAEADFGANAPLVTGVDVAPAPDETRTSEIANAIALRAGLRGVGPPVPWPESPSDMATPPSNGMPTDFQITENSHG